MPIASVGGGVLVVGTRVIPFNPPAPVTGFVGQEQNHGVARVTLGNDSTPVSITAAVFPNQGHPFDNATVAGGGVVVTQGRGEGVNVFTDSASVSSYSGLATVSDGDSIYAAVAPNQGSPHATVAGGGVVVTEGQGEGVNVFTDSASVSSFRGLATVSDGDSIYAAVAPNQGSPNATVTGGSVTVVDHSNSGVVVMQNGNTVASIPLVLPTGQEAAPGAPTALSADSVSSTAAPSLGADTITFGSGLDTVVSAGMATVAGLVGDTATSDSTSPAAGIDTVIGATVDPLAAVGSGTGDAVVDANPWSVFGFGADSVGAAQAQDFAPAAAAGNSLTQTDEFSTVADLGGSASTLVLDDGLTTIEVKNPLQGG